MNWKVIISVLGTGMLTFAAPAAAPTGLMTEYRINPFGLGTKMPRLSWRLPEGTLLQTAYEVEADGRCYGKVLSADQIGVVYPESLGPRSRTTWRVRTWDENDRVSDWSAAATFSVANLDESDWSGAQWIGTADAQAPAFLKRFRVKGKVVKATLCVTAAGFYEATLNGGRIGDKLLDPGFFAYDKRMYFSAYPLEQALKEGENELKVLLGHAWYDVRSHAAWKFDAAPWRDRPKFILNLDIVYADGRRESVVSDTSWTTAPSPIVYDDIRDGEFIDSSAAASTASAKVVTPPKGRLLATSHPATRAVGKIRPVKSWRCGDGQVIVDFGVNLTGWIRLTLRNQPQGRVVTVRYDERIRDDGRPALASSTYLRADGSRALSLTRRIDEMIGVYGSQAFLSIDYHGFQTDRYTTTGACEETYEPRFTYNGFRYAVIGGLDDVPAAEDVVAVEVATDFKKIGTFRCSDETLNKLIEATDRSYRSNFTVAVPTDCPHREKNGWTGDAQLACELAQYFYENTSAYEKWIRDIVDAQNDVGDIPGIVPTSGWGYEIYNGPGWDAALTVIPWQLYCYRRDIRVLEEAYPAVCRYLAFTAKKADGGLVSHGLGDWCAPDREKMPETEYTSSLFYYQAQMIAFRMATVLKRTTDAACYAAEARKTRAAIVAKYYRGEGTWENGGQTAQAMALGFGIVPPAEMKATEDKLIASVLRSNCQIEFGIFGSKTVLRALSNAGRADLAFQLVAGHGSRQFGSWIDRGATTLWEDLDGKSSLNHIMFGDFAAWSFQYLAGIRLAPAADWTDMIPSPTQPAFREMLIAPVPVKALSFAEADIETPYGRVFSRWDRAGEVVRYRVILPPGTVARFKTPGLPETSIGPGEHVFESTPEDPKTWAYRNPSLPTAERVKDLLSRMTIEEKCAQLGKFRAFHTFDCQNGRIVPRPDVISGIMTNCPGTVDGLSGTVDAFNTYQRIAVERSRLGIPMFFVEEGPHGLMALGEPVYPTGLGLGSSFDADLMRRIGRQIGRVRQRGVHSVYAPNLDIVRDPRWSRCEDCFGEDPELVSVLGLAEFEGLKDAGIEPCLKHYVGGGNAEGGHNLAFASMGLTELNNVQLRPFRRCIAAGSHHLMSTYHDVDGEPCTGSRFLLTDVLRDQLGFDGFVTADGGAIQLLTSRRIASSDAESAALALKAGCDGESGSATSASCGSVMLAAYKAGLLTTADLDRAVGRLLKIKFEMGLFEHPYAQGEGEEEGDGRALSLEAARKSLVLLENRGALPLVGRPSVAVIGPNADDKIMNPLGGYTAPQRCTNVVTVLDGVKAFADRVMYAKGCGLRSMKRDGFAEAERLANEADVTVLVLGESSSSYAGVQEELFRAVRAKAKKLVVVLIQGRPLIRDEIAAKADAVLLAWYPGSLGGQAIAEVLYGVVNPAGRLPVSIQQNVGQLPVCSDGIAAKRKLGDPAYPFGYGLSYTTFAYSDFDIAALSAYPNGDAAFVTVTNTGTRDGDEIVRLCFSTSGSGYQRPHRELLAFCRVSLKAGESKRVRLPYDVKFFGAYGREGRYEQPRGKVTLSVDGCEDSVVYYYTHAGCEIRNATGILETVRKPESYDFSVRKTQEPLTSLMTPPQDGETFAVCGVGLATEAVETIVADLRVAARRISPMNPARIVGVSPADLATVRPNRVFLICEPTADEMVPFADDRSDWTDEKVVFAHRQALESYRKRLEALEESVRQAGARLVYATPPGACLLRRMNFMAEVIWARASEQKLECVELATMVRQMVKREKAHVFIHDGALTPLGCRLVSACVLDAIDRASPGCMKMAGGPCFAEDEVTHELNRIYPFTARFNDSAAQDPLAPQP